MNQFIETLGMTSGILLAFVVAIMILTLFYKGLAWLSGTGAAPESLAVRGVLKKDTWATVLLSGGQTFDRVRFLGYTDATVSKAHLPFDLSGMVILEDEQQKRYLIRAKSIHMITIPPDSKKE